MYSINLLLMYYHVLLMYYYVLLIYYSMCSELISETISLKHSSSIELSQTTEHVTSAAQNLL